MQGAIVKFEEETVRGLFDTAIVNEKDRIAAAIVDSGSWLRALTDNAPADEPEPEAEPEASAAPASGGSVPPPESARGSEAASESSQHREPPKRRRTVRVRKVSIVTDESEVSHHE